jgi:hypothetical protein
LATQASGTGNLKVRIPSEEINKARAAAIWAVRLLPEYNPERIAAKQALKTSVAAEHLVKLINEWPPLTASQIDRLRGILGSAQSMEPNDPGRRNRGAAAKRNGLMPAPRPPYVRKVKGAVGHD